MTVPTSYPAPMSNLTPAGFRDGFGDVAAADIIVAVGDFTGGASEDMFTLAAHGLVDGDVLHCLWQSVMGGVTGGEGLRAVVKKSTANVFQLTTNGTTIIENTADCDAVFVKGKIPTALVEAGLIPNIIVDAWDFTGGTVEDQGTPAQGTKGLSPNDTLKLLYKSAAGVTAGTLGATYYAVGVTAALHQISLTSGGAAIDSTADGTAVFLKTS